MLTREELLMRLRSDPSDPRHIEVIPAPSDDDLVQSSLTLHLGTQYAEPISPVLLGAPPATRSFESAEFFLGSRRFVLASTLERLRLPGDLSGYLVGLSAWGRLGLVISTAEGVSPGYSGHLTLELSNMGTLPIRLKEGLRAAQLFFHEAHGSREPALLGVSVAEGDSGTTARSYTPIAFVNPQEMPAEAPLATEAWVRNYGAELRIGALRELETMISDPSATELDLQRFFERHEWMIMGDEHVDVRAQVVLQRDDGTNLRPDFFLKPVHSDLWDLLEIKKPFKRVVVGKQNRRRLSAVVREGMAQLREYSRHLDDPANRAALRQRYGILSYRPRMILLVGRSFDIGNPIKERDVRSDAGEVELMGYDELLRLLHFRAKR